MFWRVTACVSLFAWSISGCRTPNVGGSSAASDESPVSDLPGFPGGNDPGTCGRDGDEPQCAADKLCVQALDGPGKGSCIDDPDKGHRPANASHLSVWSSTPIAGGINPQYAGVAVTGDVLIGSNKCRAKGYTAEFVVIAKTVGDQRVHHVWPVKKKTGATNQICSAQLKPQYKKVSTRILSLLSSRDRVVVHGISGERTASLVFGTACPIPDCSQPPPGCGMQRPSPQYLNELGCPLQPCGVMSCAHWGSGDGADGCGPDERSVDIGPEPSNGCPHDPVCIDDATCPQLSPPPPNWCEGGQVVSRGYDARGCLQPPACLTEDTPCPLLALPPPGWCADGQIVNVGPNDNGCPLPPRCVRAGDCP